MLTSTQRKAYRGQAMGLKDSVIIGKAGLSAPLLAAVETALNKDKLIKVRFTAGERLERAAQLEALLEATGAELCGNVGKTASLYRAKAAEAALEQ